MSNEFSLPPLPNPGMTSHDYGSTLRWYTDKQMQSYARAAIEAYQRQQWQPIETAPKDGTRVLLLGKNSRHADGVWIDRYEHWTWPFVLAEPTHWQPLPHPPLETI